VVSAVNVEALAWPAVLVVAVVVPVLFAKVPLAPLPGAVKVTLTPETRLPPLSLTVACKAVANAVLMVALCGVPAVAVMEAAGPGVLVSAKFAEVAPVALATTV
jgi:hypothetical protein